MITAVGLQWLPTFSTSLYLPNHLKPGPQACLEPHQTLYLVFAHSIICCRDNKGLIIYNNIIVVTISLLCCNWFLTPTVTTASRGPFQAPPGKTPLYFLLSALILYYKWIQLQKYSIQQYILQILQPQCTNIHQTCAQV